MGFMTKEDIDELKKLHPVMTGNPKNTIAFAIITSSIVVVNNEKYEFIMTKSYLN